MQLRKDQHSGRTVPSDAVNGWCTLGHVTRSAHRHSLEHTRRPSSRLSRVPCCVHQRGVVRSRVAAAPAPALQGEEPPSEERVSAYVRPEKQTYAKEPINSTRSLRPGPEWFPAWMKYRRREDNYVFWEDKFSRNSMDIAYEEKRWTLFSTIWYLVMQTRFYAVPPAIRYLFYLGWRKVMGAAYFAHKVFILIQCQLEAHLAARALGLDVAPTSQPAAVADAAAAASGEEAAAASTSAQQESQQQQQEEVQQAQGSEPQVHRRVGPGFSRTMALRRLHWQNSLLAELLYFYNVCKTGRVHMLPPKAKPMQRPTLFWLF